MDDFINVSLSTIYSGDLYPLITKLTRVGATFTKLIDNIFTNVLCCVAFLSVVIIIDLTDHFLVICKRSILSMKANKAVSRTELILNIDYFVKSERNGLEFRV